MKLAVLSTFPQELRHAIRNLRAARDPRGKAFPLYRAKYLSHDIILVVTGMGLTHVEQALTALFAESIPDLAVLLGFGGALYDGAAIGDLVIGSQVSLVSEGEFGTIEFSCEKSLLDVFSQKPALQMGTFFTLKKLVPKREVKQAVPAGTPYPVCDMETYLFARLFSERGIPFVAIRSITDRADEEIPVRLLEVVDRSGNYRFFQAVGLLLRRPQLIPRAVALGSHANRASKALWYALDTFIHLV
jgi:adenosylhomocysteine nucleosidase